MSRQLPVAGGSDPTVGPPRTADLAATWAFLEKGVERIMTKLQVGMEYSYYMVLYSTCYNYCVSNKNNDGGIGSVSGPSRSGGGANLMGSDLYNKLTVYLQQRAKSLRGESEHLSDLALLQFYVKEWDRYTTGASYVNRLFTYLNRHWVKREKEEGRKGVYTIYTLALVQWRDNFFLPLTRRGNPLIKAMLKQIENQRNGESIDAGLIKKVVDSMVALGSDDTDPSQSGSARVNLELYKVYFQDEFIKSTEAYYRTETEDFLANNSVSDYLKKAEIRLEEEDNRVDRFLHSSTKKTLIQRCEGVLITDKKQILQDEFQSLLDADRREDLGRMWSLLARIPDGLDLLRARFEEHVKKSGLDAIARVAQSTTNAEGKVEPLDPRVYVEAMLQVYKKHSHLVDVSFRGEQGFTASLDKACRQFCNHNAVATTTVKSPELLASYVDSLLKKSNKDAGEASMEDSLNDAMTMFKFIDDKDVFQKFYQKHLAARLVKQLSISSEAEGSMISKLKDACGFEYTTKLQKMVTDVNLSNDLTDNFKEKMRASESSSDVDFSIIVGGTNNWPLQPQQTDYAIPRAILPTYERFKGFYANNHTGRKLTWLWHLHRTEIRMNWTSPKYILMASAYQMAVILLFNDNLSLSYAEIEEGTKMSPQYLKPVLNLLVKAKILLQEGDQYDLNLNFKSKKIKVNINQAIRAEQKQESSDVMKGVEEDRKFVYQAMIVRVMKSRKTMRHQALIQEVTGIISSMFTPKIPELKKAIDYLLDKEYIERKEGQADVYNYLA